MVEYISAKSIVSRTKSREWFGTDYNMNIYRGCCHGCIYCDSRSECYRIPDFDKICVKENALQIIRDDLRRKVKSGVVGTGAMSDPYNPLERELHLTRHALELVDAFGFGVAVDTKSDLIVRDKDILQSIATHSPVICKVTITSSEDELCKKIEPNVSRSSERFEAIAKLTEAGIFAGVLMTPILPFIEDNKENILGIIHKAKEAGAKFIYPSFGVTLRQNQREWYLNKLEENFKGEKLRERYEKQFSNSYSCNSPKAKALWAILASECEKSGIYYTMSTIIRAYQSKYQYEQLSLWR